MTWFRVDDSFAFHAKIVAAGNAALGLWVRAGAWSSQQLTDGFVPTHMVPSLGNRAQATALVKAGVWLDEEGGYRFHDWLNYQPSAAEVEADRASKHEAKVQAGRAGGVASGIARRKHSPSRDEAEAKQDASKTEANGKQNEAPSLPVPTQPQSSSKTGGAKKRATPTPDIFPITPAMASWGRKNAPAVTNPQNETEAFLDWTRANGKTYLSWESAWRTWMNRAQKYAGERPASRAAMPSRVAVDPHNTNQPWLN